MSTAAAEFPGRPESARAARALVHQVLGEDHPSACDAALIVSELVANAVAHTRSGQPGGTVSVTVEASAQPPGVRIRVQDAGGPGVPALADPGPGEEHGRGLAIVGTLAAEWGSEATGTGRATWCQLTDRPAERNPTDMSTSQNPGKDNQLRSDAGKPVSGPGARQVSRDREAGPSEPPAPPDEHLRLPAGTAGVIGRDYLKSVIARLDVPAPQAVIEPADREAGE